MHVSFKKRVIFVFAVIIFVVASVFVTLYLYGALPSFKSSRASYGQSYRNVTFTDASLSCEKETKKDFGISLNDMLVDTHSSRYEARDYAYRVYLEVHASLKNKKSTLFYINCYVHAGSGRIILFEVLEHVDAPESRPQTQDSQTFGWPMR